jgi:hypothetical protein
MGGEEDAMKQKGNELWGAVLFSAVCACESVRKCLRLIAITNTLLYNAMLPSHLSQLKSCFNGCLNLHKFLNPTMLETHVELAPYPGNFTRSVQSWDKGIFVSFGTNWFLFKYSSYPLL